MLILWWGSSATRFTASFQHDKLPGRLPTNTTITAQNLATLSDCIVESTRVSYVAVAENNSYFRDSVKEQSDMEKIPVEMVTIHILDVVWWT